MNSDEPINNYSTKVTNNCLADKYFLTVIDVKTILGVSKSTAYREIQRLNEELKSKGYITVSGKIPTKYFMERLYC